MLDDCYRLLGLRLFYFQSVIVVEPVGTPLRLGVPWHFMGRPADERQRELTWRTC